MRKAAIITAFDPSTFRGGIETFTVNVAETLQGKGFQTEIYHTGMVEGVHGFHNDFLGKLYMLGKKVFHSKEPYEMVIANAFYGIGYFPPTVKTFNIYHLTHMGFAEEIKNTVPRDQYLEWKYLWGDFCESACGFNRIKIAVSESVKDELSRFYGFNDVSVLPNAVDTNIFMKSDRVLSRRKWAIPESAYVGLYVGRWDILKGCDILEGVIRRKPDVYWVLVLATGSDRKAAPQMGNVKIIEQLEHGLMSELYSAADFMLFPSRYEGFGYVIIEAIACELPVITSNVGIAKTIYKCNPFKDLLLPEITGSAEAVVLSAIEKIDFLKMYNDWKKDVVKEGRRLIVSEFNIETWKKRLVRILGI